MEITTHPLFALYVMWHPSYPGGRQIADEIRMHFSRNLYRAVEEERGVSVLERCEPVPDSLIPLPIDWDNAEFTAVVVLADSTLVDDRDWVDHVRSIAQTAKRRGIPAGFFPVTMDRRALELGVDQQALRWDSWDAPDAERVIRLTSDLTHEFCRMLRHRLDRLWTTGSGEMAQVCSGQPLAVSLSPSPCLPPISRRCCSCRARREASQSWFIRVVTDAPIETPRRQRKRDAALSCSARPKVLSQYRTPVGPSHQVTEAVHISPA